MIDTDEYEYITVEDAIHSLRYQCRMCGHIGQGTFSQDYDKPLLCPKGELGCGRAFQVDRVVFMSKENNIIGIKEALSNLMCECQVCGKISIPDFSGDFTKPIKCPIRLHEDNNGCGNKYALHQAMYVKSKS